MSSRPLPPPLCMTLAIDEAELDERYRYINRRLNSQLIYGVPFPRSRRLAVWVAIMERLGWA